MTRGSTGPAPTCQQKWELYGKGWKAITLYPHSPVLTTNGYQFATLDGNYAEYAAMEMDDATVAKACTEQRVAFGCVRNISDPAVNTELGQKAGSDWASQVYRTYGLCSTYNDSLAAWSILDLEP